VEGVHLFLAGVYGVKRVIPFKSGARFSDQSKSNRGKKEEKQYGVL
jgi:hypothetical protein